LTANDPYFFPERILVAGRGRLWAALALIALALPALAETGRDFTIRGFGTLGAVRTSGDDVEFVRDISQPRGATDHWNARTDSVLGVQANWRLTPVVEAVVQGVSRYRYDRTFKPEIAWAFLKIDPNPALSLRLGRLGTEFFMLADSRLVGYSYLTVRPPGDYFWYLPFYSVSGADAALTVPVGDSMLRGKVYYGIADGKIPLADKQWKIDGSPLMGAYLEYQTGNWLLRGSYANIRFNSSLPIADDVAALVPGISFAGRGTGRPGLSGDRRHAQSLLLAWPGLRQRPLAVSVDAQCHRSGQQGVREFVGRLCAGRLSHWLGDALYRLFACRFHPAHGDGHPLVARCVPIRVPNREPPLLARAGT
jgi:hypothetical protein